MTDSAQPIFERGDIVYGDDPFDGGSAARPWLILTNHEGRPFHGDQYIVLTLTTRSWLDGLIEIPDDCWIRGGTPKTSRIVPWGVQSLDRSDIDFWQGSVDNEIVDDAVSVLIEELQA